MTVSLRTMDHPSSMCPLLVNECVSGTADPGTAVTQPDSDAEVVLLL